jgi:hypothetical protein
MIIIPSIGSMTQVLEVLTTQLQKFFLRLVSAVFLRLVSAVRRPGNEKHMEDGRASRPTIRPAVTLLRSFVLRLRIGRRLRIAE